MTMLLNIKDHEQHIAFTANAEFTGKLRYGEYWCYRAIDINRNVPLYLITRDGNITTDRLSDYEWELEAGVSIPEDLLK